MISSSCWRIELILRLVRCTAIMKLTTTTQVSVDGVMQANGPPGNPARRSGCHPRRSLDG